MATYNSIDTFRDPSQIDILSTLGKAQTYLQQNYDTNVQETQSLINQYLGTDLLRDVDQKYLTERLGTLVEYVNQAGTRNWTKKSVAKEIQGYIGQAIDENVMAAIASTQSYRKQRAEIDHYKKAGKGEWSLQNEWMATQDLARYMSSGQVGDYYRAGTYTPYRDVSKKILDNIKVLKEHGVDYVPFSQEYGSGGFFRMVGTREVLSPAKVQQYLGAILDTSDMNQLYIDGMYSLKDKSTDEIKTMYKDLYETRNKAIDNSIADLKLELGNATKKEDKDILNRKIEALKEEKSSNDLNMSKELSRENLVSSYYSQRFFDNYSNFLSFNRVKDWKVDDSMFQLYKEQNRQAEAEARLKFDYDKLNIETNLAEQRLQMDMLKAGVKKDATGKIVMDPSSPFSGVGDGEIPGVAVVDLNNDLSVEENPNIVGDNISRFNDAYAKLNGPTTYGTLRRIVNSDPELKAMYGGQSDAHLVGLLINSPGKSWKLRQALIEDGYTGKGDKNKHSGLIANIDNAVSLKRGVSETVDKYIKGSGGIFSEVSKVADKMSDAASNFKENLDNALDNYYINNEGNLTKNKAYSNSRYSKLRNEIAVLANEMNYAEDNEKEIWRRALYIKISESGLSDKQQKAIRKIVDNDTISVITPVTTSSSVNGNPSNAVRFVSKTQSFFRNNRQLSELGNSFLADIPGVDIDKVNSNITEQISAIKNASKNLNDTVLKRGLRVDFRTEESKNLATRLRLSLPEEAQSLQVDEKSYIELSPSDIDGQYTVRVSYKNSDGDYEMSKPYQVSSLNLPSNLVKKLSTENSALNPYSVKNEYAVPVSSESVTLARNPQEVIHRKQGLPPRLQAMRTESVHQIGLMKTIQNASHPDAFNANIETITNMLQDSYTVKMVKGPDSWIQQVYDSKGNLFRVIDSGMTEYDPLTLQTTFDMIVGEAIMNNALDLTTL